MYLKSLKRYIPILIGFFILSACFSGKEGKKAGTSQRVAVHKHGIILDAKYDPRLDNLIPGYKIITVAVTNNGYDILRLNPLKDRWEITDAYGRKQKAMNSIRIKDPSTFSRLPDQVQQLVDYPVGISVGYSETIDLFFPATQELKAFRSISFYSADRKLVFDVMSNLDSPSHQPTYQATKIEAEDQKQNPSQ